MALLLEIDESNDDSGDEAIHHGLTAIQCGSADAWDLDPVAAFLTPGDSSFEKWLRYHFTDLGDAASLGGLKVWGEAPSDGETSLYANATTVGGTYAGQLQTVFDMPVDTTTRTPTALPTSEPGSANLGIAGSLTGALSAPGYSDYLLLQVRTTVSATTGDTVTISFGYEVTA